MTKKAKNTHEVFRSRTIHQDREKSVALVWLWGKNVPAQYGLTAEYEVLWGRGKVGINGEVTELSAGDSFTVYPGDTAQDAGHMALLVTCRPPYAEGRVNYDVEPQLPASPPVEA
jgi:mannose-6-phosphate isomerase-like protein (cupin superfamily)